MGRIRNLSEEFQKQSSVHSGQEDVHETFVVEKERYRHFRLARRIYEELMFLVPDEMKDRRISSYPHLRITRVECVPDLSFARCYFLFDEPEGKESISRAEKVFETAAGFLRKEVHSRLGIKYCPQLIFEFDHGTLHADRIEQLLAELPKAATTVS